MKGGTILKFIYCNKNKLGQTYANIISINTSLAAPGALAHRLQRRTACKTQNGQQGASKWPTGSGKWSSPRFLRKGRDGEKN